jgi:DNA-binding LytR/AlgR family response regulator
LRNRFLYNEDRKDETEGTALKITIHEDPNAKEIEISIVCAEMTAELEEIIANIGLVGHTFAGKKDGETFFIPMKDIYFFESVDGKIFFYTEKETYEAAARLYKIEESLQNSKFARISKTAIANLSKMRSIKPAENSRLMATLLNGEKILVSRQYVSEIKQKLGV